MDRQEISWWLFVSYLECTVTGGRIEWDSWDRSRNNKFEILKNQGEGQGGRKSKRLHPEVERGGSEMIHAAPVDAGGVQNSPSYEHRV